MLAAGAPATLGIEQRTAGVRLAASRGRRRAELEPWRSLANRVMSPARIRGGASRWFDTGCATMVEFCLNSSAASVLGAAIVVVHGYGCSLFMICWTQTTFSLIAEMAPDSQSNHSDAKECETT